MKVDTIAGGREHLLTLTGVRIPKLTGQIALVFIAYFVAGKLGQATDNIRSGNIGPVWPASGVALAAVLAYGPRVWPAIFLSGFLVAFQSPVFIFAAIGQAAGATLAAVIAGCAMRRMSGFQPTLVRLRDALAFIGWSAASAIVSSSIGTASLYFSGATGYTGLVSTWLIYCLGDATGAWLITPLVFSVPALPVKSIARALQFAGLLTVIVALSVLLFGGMPVAPFEVRLMTFAVLPFVMWAAIGFGVGGASISVLLIATIATLLTAFGAGPFVDSNAFVGAVRLEVFFFILAMTGLTLGAMLGERDAAHATTERLTLSRRLIEAQEQERRRIARELHDDISQRLSMVAIKLQRSPKLQQYVSEIASDVQSLSHRLHSSRLELLGIVVSMRHFCAEFGVQQKAVIEFECEPLPSPLRSDISLCLFRVLQESLHNAGKHSGVGAFQVRVWAVAGEVHLTVTDQGRGFDVSEARRGLGIGLASIEERVKLVGGRLSVSSRPGSGSTIHAIVPGLIETSSPSIA